MAPPGTWRGRRRSRPPHLRRGVDLGGGVLAGFHVADDLAAGRHDEGVDPDHVALVPVGLDTDHLLLALGRLDHLVPGEARFGRIDAGRLRGRLAVPEQLGVGPERGRHQLVVPVHRLQRGVEDAVGEGGLVLLGERTEEAGVGELGDERRVQAHHVDRAVLGGQPPDQLLPLVGRRVRQRLDVDLVGTVRRVDAFLGEAALPAVVRVDVPVQGRGTALGPASHEEVDEHEYCHERERSPSCPLPSRPAAHPHCPRPLQR